MLIRYYVTGKAFLVNSSLLATFWGESKVICRFLAAGISAPSPHPVLVKGSLHIHDRHDCKWVGVFPEGQPRNSASPLGRQLHIVHGRIKGRWASGEGRIHSNF